MDCTNTGVDGDCNVSYEYAADFIRECRPHIDNLTEFIKDINESIQEHDKGIFGFLK